MNKRVRYAAKLYGLHTCQKILQYLHAFYASIQLGADDLQEFGWTCAYFEPSSAKEDSKLEDGKLLEEG